VADLDSMQMLALRQAKAGEPRLQALADALGEPRAELGDATLEQVFEDYYASGLNSATLPAYGRLLARLAGGELLSPRSTDLLLGHMRAINTGSRRIQAGLPPDADFAQKPAPSCSARAMSACSIPAWAATAPPWWWPAPSALANWSRPSRRSRPWAARLPIR